jgi:hypothetical protein
MSDVEIVSILLIFVCATLALGSYFHTYYGVYDNLTNAVIGDVYNFYYEQPLTGEYHRYLAKVIDVYKFSDEYIKRLNQNSKYRRTDENFSRGRTLVTCQMADGTIRNFYAERSTECRRPLAAKLMFRLGLAKFI